MVLAVEAGPSWPLDLDLDQMQSNDQQIKKVINWNLITGISFTYSLLLILKLFLFLHWTLMGINIEGWFSLTLTRIRVTNFIRVLRWFRGLDKEKGKQQSSISSSCIPTRINYIYTDIKVSKICQLILLTWGLMSLVKEK